MTDYQNNIDGLRDDIKAHRQRSDDAIDRMFQGINPTGQRVREAIDHSKRHAHTPPLVRTGQGDTARDYNPPPTDPMIGVRIRCVALGLAVGFVLGVWIGGVM